MQNWQVMITTHSPIFIDVSKPHTTIIRVDKDIDSKTRIFSTEKANFDEDERQRLQMIRMCNPSINEFFFANKIILVEGDTEQTVLNYIKSINSKYTGIQIVNCRGKANIPMFMKILNHFGLSYTAIHDIDAPYSMRKGKKVKNAMWTINEKIFNESRIKNGMDNMIIANMPDFEFQYFKYLQSGDKPYNAICELRNVEFINSDRYVELVNILESIISRKHNRSIKSIDDYYILLSKYVKEEMPEPKEIWQLDEYKQAFKEVIVTEETIV